jgi:hypothetical protein
VPTESDCRFLESPPAVPPLRIYQVTYRPGRPRKKPAEDTATVPWSIKGQQRY